MKRRAWLWALLLAVSLGGLMAVVKRRQTKAR